MILPDEVLFSVGILIPFAGIGVGPPYRIVGGGLTSTRSIVMAGAPTGAIGARSAHRRLDARIGCTAARVADELLRPRDREADEALPGA